MSEGPSKCPTWHFNKGQFSFESIAIFHDFAGGVYNPYAHMTPPSGSMSGHMTEMKDEEDSQGEMSDEVDVETETDPMPR